MAGAPPPPLNTLSRPAVRWLVLLGDNAGNPPTALTDAVDWLTPLEIRRVTGGRTPDTTKLSVDLSKAGIRWQDIGVPTGSNRIVEVRDATRPAELASWGKLEADGANIGKGETLSINCPLPWYLLGGVLDTVPHHDGVNTATVELQQDLVFNPEIKNRVHGNCSSVLDSDGAHLFVHRESMTTGPAQTAQAQNAGKWSLARAAHRIIWTLNPDEDYLTNPTLAAVELMLDDSDRDAMLVNFKIKRGQNLPQSLDKLLKPHGYTWHLKWSGAVGAVVTTLEIIKLGDGPTQTLKCQRLGDTINNQQTNVESVATTYDLGVSPNAYTGTSAIERREVTVELTPGWSDADDQISWEDLHKLPEHRSDGAKRNVGRKWIFDTAGDYIGLRPEYTAAVAVDGVDMLPRRRRFFPCITRGPEGDTIADNGYHLSYHNAAEDEVQAPFGFNVLTDETGIWLTGKLDFEMWHNFQLWAVQAREYKLKLTATIEMDAGQSYTADPRSVSVNAATVPHLLDLSHRFRQQVIQKTGNNMSRFYLDHHRALSSVTTGGAGSAVLTASSAVDDDLKVGQRVSVVGDPGFEGIYTATAVSGSDITVAEEITTTDPVSGGVIGLNTDEEDCTQRLEDYIKEVQRDQDHARATVQATLAGVDWPAYKLGDLVTGVQPRNVTFNGLGGGGARYPQILGITYKCQLPQRTVLRLEPQPHV